MTFSVPKDSYFHVIGYAKLESSDGTSTSSSTQASIDAYVGGTKRGSAVNLTTSWQRMTARSDKAGSNKTGAEARLYRKHAGKKAVLFDDIVAYVSTNSEVDLTAPSSATSASGTGTELTWTYGSDDNTGIQATMIWKRTSGTEKDLTLNNQGIYALAATEGPKVDQSGHWELITASLAADATSYSGTFEGNEVYAVVHRDLAYNYSAPTYITIPDLSTRTLYLKPGTNWSQKGGEVNPRFAVYCYGDGEQWYDMEAVDAGCGSGTVYKAEVLAKYPNCIFCRMAGDHPDNSWENPPLWNKTADLTIPEPKAGVYEVPNNAWTGSDNSHWRTTPLNICVSGTWLCFAGEQLTLTATSTGATHYQWYKGGTAEGNKIAGATTETFIIWHFAYEDAGDYYCKARMGDGTEVTSGKFTVKTLRMYFNNGRGGGDYGHIDLQNTDPDNHKATGMIFLGQTWTYAFCVADGVGHYYGCNNDNDHKMWSGNCTNWSMNADGIQCLLWSENGATYTFTVDYSNITVPVVSAIYPPDNQAAGYKIYFDNSEVNWEDHLYYRIGRGGRGATDHTWAEPISKVPGTTNLYYHTTPDYTDLDAWHIADNEGNQGSGNGYSIYQTNTDDATTEIKKSVTYEGGAVAQDLTIVPVGTHSTGSAGYNNHCEFYNYTMLPGMKTQNVMVDDTEHGTITVSYTDVDGNAQSFSSGDRDLAHTCILTITATPDCGYSLSSLTVNGVDFTSGNTFIVDARTIIEAEFEIDSYTVTLHPDGGLILAGDVTEYTYGIGATLPTHMSKIGKDFMGWYDNSGCTGSPVTEISATDCGNKEYWAKWENETTKVTYIIGSCQVTGEEWIQGQDGSYSAWLFKGGATPAANTLKATSDIKIPSLNGVSQYFTTKDVAQLPVNSMWTTSSGGTKTIRAFKVGSGSTLEFDLKDLEASAIMFFVFPNSTSAYSVDLTVNGVTESHAIPEDEQYQLHRFDYFGDTYTGKFKIKSVGKESRVVIVVEVPTVTITFDKNSASATGTMDPLVVPKGTQPTLTANSFAWTDHEFQCWTEGSTTGPEIADEATYTATANVTLYAKWVEHVETTVTLDATGATNDYTNSVTAVYTQAMPEITVLPTREWYIFDGYFENPDGSGTQYYSSTGESTHAWDKTTPTATIYAKWTEIKHTTITLVATGAYNHYTQSVVATYEKPMPTIESLPMSTTAVFAGYFTNPDGTGTQYYTASGSSSRNWDQDVTAQTLYAKWLDPCDIPPTLTPAAPIVTVWNGQKADITLATLSCSVDTTTLKYAYVSASEDITGCSYSYFDSRIHIIGTPTGYTTTVTKTITFTFQNNCVPANTYTVDQTIRIYPEDQKARIAFILTGEENKGHFDKYEESDSTNCAELISYLSRTYDVKCVNGYATKNEATLSAYYNDYDLLIVTDFLNTGKGYTNAIGTLIDKKPILSFEAYVANQSNWHIGSNPKDPNPKVQDMKVLCAGHAIFADAKYDEEDPAAVDVINDTDTTVHVLDALSSADKAKGLQGFVINEAPDFIFLATVRDANNNRDLIVCCERQVVFSARLMLYGINFYEMGNLSKAGRIIIRQMVDYLLMTDETKIADCSLVFDNGAGNPDKSSCGDNLWSNPANWGPGYNIIPTPVHPTRIIAECHVDYDAAHAGSVKVNQGRDENGNPVDGKLIIEPTGGLTIAGMVAKVNDTRYASPITIAAEDLLIKASETHNGAFVYGNKESDVRATVEYYSRAFNAKTDNPVWQYMGIPFRAAKTAINMYYAAWMCRWAEGSTDNLGGLWQWVNNDDVLLPFEGYCITQESAKTYTFSGKLNAPVTTVLPLDNRDTEGYAFAANSWTAPIKIQEMQDEDFVHAEKAIYIYHTGSYKNWQDNGTPVDAHSGSAATLKGQYAVIPIHSSPYLTGADSVIPSMQGFFVKTTPSEAASLKLVYNRVVYDATYFKTSTQPMRAPKRNGTPEVMVLNLVGDKYADRVHILQRSDFSDEFEDGWDGRKIEGDADVPMLALIKQGGEMSVAAVETADDHYLSFRAGCDSIYTFSFDYDGETLYLYDLFTQQATEIRTGNTYSFEATDRTPSQRFLITATPPRTPTDVDATASDKAYQPKKLIRDGHLFIIQHDAVYDALGTRVEFRKEGAK